MYEKGDRVFVRGVPPLLDEEEEGLGTVASVSFSEFQNRVYVSPDKPWKNGGGMGTFFFFEGHLTPATAEHEEQFDRPAPAAEASVGLTLDPKDPIERVLIKMVETNRRKRADYAENEEKYGVRPEPPRYLDIRLPFKTEEQAELIYMFAVELDKASGDGGKKRAAGLKPSWKVDTEHEGAVFSHIMKWKRPGKHPVIDPDSGTHTLVHAAWRCLAIALQEMHPEWSTSAPGN